MIDSVALMEELVTVQEDKLQMLEPKEQESEAAEFGEVILHPPPPKKKKNRIRT